MPKKYYKIDLLGGAAIHVYFETANGVITNFVVKLVFTLNNRYYEIVRFDTAHGCPHKDVLDTEGKVKRKIWYDFLDYNLNLARVGGFHLQGIEGRSHSRLLQALHNAADGSLRLARRVKKSK